MQHAVSRVFRRRAYWKRASIDGKKGFGREQAIPRQRITPGRPGTGLSALLRLMV
jgi:hypothetical protein